MNMSTNSELCQLPRLSVTFSLLKVQEVAPLADMLRSHHARVIFIGSSSPEQVAEFLQSATAIPVCGDLYTDPSVTLYNYFRLKRGMLRSLVRPLLTGVKTYGLRGVVEGLRLARETSPLAGDSWQQGGTVLLVRAGAVLYQHTEEHPTDWPSMEEVLRLVGISDTKADYKKALSDWLKMRAANRAGQKQSVK
ncbi:hypothetical protein ACOMHN_013301 [Nucella lapillus]